MKIKRALLIAAHGSRRQQSNDEIKQLANKVIQQADGQFDWVCHAFLELTEPSIENGIDHCVELGANEIVVLPYFLSAGRHVAEDVPGIVQSKQREYAEQNVRLRLQNYLGASPVMVGLIMEAALAEKCACGEMMENCHYPACQA